MKDLKITKGDLVIKNSGTDAFPFYQILEEISEVAATHNLTVAKLIVDSYNTAQKCGLLPSELLRQRDELKEAFNQMRQYWSLIDSEADAEQIAGSLWEVLAIAEAAIKNTEG